MREREVQGKREEKYVNVCSAREIEREEEGERILCVCVRVCACKVEEKEKKRRKRERERHRERYVREGKFNKATSDHQFTGGQIKRATK